MYKIEEITKRAMQIKKKYGSTYAIGIVCIAIAEGDVPPLHGREIIVKEILRFKKVINDE